MPGASGGLRGAGRFALDLGAAVFVQGGARGHGLGEQGVVDCPLRLWSASPLWWTPGALGQAGGVRAAGDCVVGGRGTWRPLSPPSPQRSSSASCDSLCQRLQCSWGRSSLSCPCYSLRCGCISSGAAFCRLAFRLRRPLRRALWSASRGCGRWSPSCYLLLRFPEERLPPAAAAQCARCPGRRRGLCCHTTQWLHSESARS
ncbi:uncharacterized protein LOC121042851 isoform X1 [Herpailurus yagouaroundi]|uniref:uncharacterized protein LOC121042851 isoform X1 n=1 Tax=Herpailurus yagouaroundi TaxID=1608482 RepID=UPI001AD6179D|nr:uncharacterized protein LOC121042851 isoform X1 [Puma yagouaroundi]